MKPPQPKLPKSAQQPAQQHQQEERLRELLSRQSLEALVLQRFRLPDSVAEFNRFEELSKLYEIEQPFVGRTQVELLFDVYDGRRLQQGLFGSLDDSEVDQTSEGKQQDEQEAAAAGKSDHHQQQQQQQQHQNHAQPTTGSSQSWSSDATRRRSNFAIAHAPGRIEDGATKSGGSGLSWCRVLFARRQKSSAERKRGSGGSAFGCCLRPSATNQDLGLMSVSTSGQSLAVRQPCVTSSSPLLSSAQAALAPNPADELDESEMKREALGVISNALAANSTGRPGEMGPPEPNLGPALAMESAQMESTGGSVSVCLLDKRGLARDTTVALQGRRWPANGRRWARAAARMVQLRRKLRKSSARPQLKLSKLSGQGGNLSERDSRLISKQLDRVAGLASHKFWSGLARDNLAKSGSSAGRGDGDGDDCDYEYDDYGHSKSSRNQTDHHNAAAAGGKRQKIDAEQLIELVKGSLNQLIDAQLLLRNKLTNAEQLNSSPIMARIRSAEYENLLRNNFNLLKIWQNLEETSEGLVCFVCEPIKTNLADLFWFNRNRLDWAPARVFEAMNLNSNTTLTGLSAASSGAPLQFISPLVCLDAAQVKRGLLQILEALNFLHTICRLIHRNLSPRNILICHADNWKLSGLEFAVRFESTLISESASMMAHEFAQARFASAQTSLSYHLAGGTGGLGGCGAGGGPSSLAPPGSGGPPLRRQRTLHQTKCTKFEEPARCSLLLQPDLDYLAPEILRQAKCSHKSDLFSFGLILGQTYDLCRHKSPISCNSRVRVHETELKKLDERRKWKLAQLAPLEMRLVLVEMLDLEPNLRPSASYVLQLLKRPLELCKSNEDSLRHLRQSLDYLEARFCLQTGLVSAAAAAASNQTGGAGTADYIGGGPSQQAGRSLANQKHRAAGVGNYFRRVTSASAAASERSKRRQTRTLQLLNCFVRALDASALAAAGLPTSVSSSDNQQRQQKQQQPHQWSPSELCMQQQQQQQVSTGRRPSFGSMRLQFEQTLETLRQVLNSSSTPSDLLSGARRSGGGGGASNAVGCGALPVDSRSLLLLVALHRRLLEQAGQLRQELPPLCRLIAPSSGASSQPLDRSLTSAAHRTLADLEERLCLTISQQSIGRLAQSLADPLLKLEEFLLVFELVNDLVSFVGQKCRQNYSLRGKQLLNELTPVTGCPSLSSSEEEDEAEEQEALAAALAASGALLNESDDGGLHHQQQQQQQHHHHHHHHYQDESRLAENQIATSGYSTLGGSALALAMQPSGGGGGGGGHHAKRSSQQSLGQHHQFERNSRQLYNLPTSINVTAPSPMGSTRDVSRHQVAASSPDSDHASLFTTIGSSSNNNLSNSNNNNNNHHTNTINPSSRCNSPLGNLKRHSHQDVLCSTEQLAGKTSQMSLGPRMSPSSTSRRSIANCLAGAGDQTMAGNQRAGGASSPRLSDSSGDLQVRQKLQDDNKQQPPQDDESRSKLIDELLKTINDDSFNEFIDFNNKLIAATKSNTGSTSSQPDQMDSGQMVDLVNAGRPKSALGGGDGAARGSSSSTLASGGAANSSSVRPPRTLNLNSQQQQQQQLHNNAANKSPAAGRPNQRGSICVTPAVNTNQASSTFDNVIRRMSTNFVQNFNKIGATTGLGSVHSATATSDALGSSNHDLMMTTTTTTTTTTATATTAASNSAANCAIRREKSSTTATTNYSNSLYVDNQIPARRHSDNTINVPRIQVALSSPSSSGSRTNLNQRASQSASKLATKWKLTAKTNQREASDKLSPNLSGALGYIRRHSSGNTQGGNSNDKSGSNNSGGNHDNQSNGLGASLLNASPFKTRSNSNLGIDFLMSNRSMKRRYSAASMLGHQTQRKAEDLIDAGMKSVQNMFS